MNPVQYKHTIFWADDDNDDLEMFREILEAYASDHQVVEFGNGMELLNFLNTQEEADHPCLIVLDLNMPVMGGREALASLKDDEDLKHIPVAVFTTSNSHVDRNFCERYNVEMFTKPPSYSQLKSAVERLVDLCSGKKSQRA